MNKKYQQMCKLARNTPWLTDAIMSLFTPNGEYTVWSASACIASHYYKSLGSNIHYNDCTEIDRLLYQLIAKHKAK